jgi:hypothetical protein
MLGQLEFKYWDVFQKGIVMGHPLKISPNDFSVIQMGTRHSTYLGRGKNYAVRMLEDFNLDMVCCEMDDQIWIQNHPKQIELNRFAF